MMFSLFNKYAAYSLKKKNNLQDMKDCSHSVAIKVSALLSVSMLALDKHVTRFNSVHPLCKIIIYTTLKTKLLHDNFID